MAMDAGTRGLRAVVLGISLVVAALALGGCGDFMTDAATRLANQIEDEASALRASGESRRTFRHLPKSSPEGIDGDYRIAFTLGRDPPRPGHRGVTVQGETEGSIQYRTTYHLRFVEIPKDLVVHHRRGEATLITLEQKEGRVLLTDLR